MFRRRWNGGGSPRWLSAGVPRNEAMKVKAQLDNRSVRRTRRKGIEGVDETRSWDPDEKERGNSVLAAGSRWMASDAEKWSLYLASILLASPWCLPSTCTALSSEPGDQETAWVMLRDTAHLCPQDKT
ncbi:uncharacterized protein LOC103882502 isoform X2 [Papio anubis]|uniref:uncharacterized protein LOC103882502 isoform X2 n=1 Tax=Papio anubis TaxID=9555 RepID=UPI0012AE58EA|nr:uncharacterized protein LOC103882502 isoform X2 [Papio anubis]